MGKYQAPPGTHDVYPSAPRWQDNSRAWGFLESTFRDLCRDFGYQEIRTPIFEQTELFARAVGEGTDIVSKEMYTFVDRGNRSMTLRPEGTAGVLRAYLEDKIYAEGGVSKLFYIGPNFRYERAQRGRYRQHTQCGIEAIGSSDPRLDAEIIVLALSFLRRLGIQRLTLKINSVGCPECRPRYREALLDYTRPILDKMSEDNQRRFVQNPLRMLDSKDETDQNLLETAPVLIDYLCDGCREHFAAVRAVLADLGEEAELDTRLVRGFDYYTKTAFEVVSPDIGAQSSLCGGGRYDGLVEELGGDPTPGIGFGLGVERALIALESLGTELPGERGLTAFVVTLGEAARSAAPRVLTDLRTAGVSADADYLGKSMKAQMRSAGKSGAKYAIVMGDDEIAQRVLQVKNMETGEQTQVPIDGIVVELKREVGQCRP